MQFRDTMESLDCAETISKFSEVKTCQDLDSDRVFASAIMREFEVSDEAASAISKPSNLLIEILEFSPKSNNWNI